MSDQFQTVILSIAVEKWAQDITSCSVYRISLTPCMFSKLQVAETNGNSEACYEDT